MVESDIVINGRTLSFAEAMTVRVAMSSFSMYVNEPETAKALGPIAEGYQAHCASLLRLIHTRTK